MEFKVCRRERTEPVLDGDVSTDGMMGKLYFCHSLFVTHFLSLTFCHSLFVTQILSLTFCHSLFVTLFLSLTFCHSLFVTHFLSHTFCHHVLGEKRSLWKEQKSKRPTLKVTVLLFIPIWNQISNLEHFYHML